MQQVLHTILAHDQSQDIVELVQLLLDDEEDDDEDDEVHVSRGMIDVLRVGNVVIVNIYVSIIALLGIRHVLLTDRQVEDEVTVVAILFVKVVLSVER
mgnify:CR=1 FL=1|jgi:hypothetical protein